MKSIFKMVTLQIVGLFLFSNMAFGVPPDNGLMEVSAIEILGLPTANRENIIKKLSDQTYEDLKKIAFSEKEAIGTRWKALMAIGQSRKPESILDLVEASSSQLWFIRNGALLALHAVDKGEAEDVAKRLIKDKALVVRSAAVDVLRYSRDSEVRELLWSEIGQSYNFVNKQSLWIRAQIIEVLIPHATKDEQNLFSKYLADEDKKVAIGAMIALERILGQDLSQIKDPSKKIKALQDLVKKNYIEI